jgi:hypothetical protein
LTPANDRNAYAAELLIADTYGLPRPAPDSIARDDLDLPPFAEGARCSVGVKWTSHERGGLYVAAAQPLHSLAYILVTGVGERMAIRGFAWRRMLDAAPIVDRGYGEGRYIEQAELRPVAILMACHGLTARD